MNKVKMLPYGISSFEEIKENDMYCVDKSMYLPKLELAGDFLFLIRRLRNIQAGLSDGQHQGEAAWNSRILDGNVLLRQESDKVPEGSLSCPD